MTCLVSGADNGKGRDDEDRREETAARLIFTTEQPLPWLEKLTTLIKVAYINHAFHPRWKAARAWPCYALLHPFLRLQTISHSCLPHAAHMHIYLREKPEVQSTEGEATCRATVEEPFAPVQKRRYTYSRSLHALVEIQMVQRGARVF